ncbi:hypothetical protein SAMN05216480_1057 [Pustulibacterium marinum]|uniref:Uncharacterized protein n=1 Tax=Pustulibacterium marinum TaxID=1224947 RepID=A0A1I7GJP2_9FLAO|nr:hypothetical protein [Pustulibacterium marinum]SFU48664.1 hypothetical protein SAMN05216480_1057 [Pustulibacterium marinum]
MNNAKVIMDFNPDQMRAAAGKIKKEEVTLLSDILKSVFKLENIKVVNCFQPRKIKFVQVTTQALITSDQIKDLELHLIANQLDVRYGFKRSGVGITVFFF